MIETFYRREEGGHSSEDEPPSSMNSAIQVQTIVHDLFGVIVSDSTRNQIKKVYPDHVYQRLGSGWCGPAVVSRIFYKSGYPLDQEEIAMTILSDGRPLYDEKWGSSHARIREFLSMYFYNAHTKSDCSIEEIRQYLEDGKEIIANVRAMDDLGEDGHYVAVTKIDFENKLVEIYDPTNAIRADGLHGVYTLSIEKFTEEWWDYATPQDEVNDIKTFGWIACVDSLSLKTSANSQDVNAL